SHDVSRHYTHRYNVMSLHFPYTTLCRSNAQSIATASPRVVALALGAEDYTASMGALRTKAGPEIFYARMQVLQACRLAGISAQEDRKSTRLNSSHVSLSYAVFCVTSTSQ